MKQSIQALLNDGMTPDDVLTYMASKYGYFSGVYVKVEAILKEIESEKVNVNA